MVNRSHFNTPGQTARMLVLAASLAVPALGCMPGAGQTTVGAGAAGGTAYQIVAPATLGAESAVTAPRGEPVLAVTGKIAHTNAGASLTLDLATIEQLGLVKYTVKDPWEKRTVSYTGVLLSDLLKYAGASASAKSVHLVALDDYEGDITLEDIARWPILVATRSDGEAISLEAGGPTRVIFPIHAYQIGPAYNDQWVWSIKTIDVR